MLISQSPETLALECSITSFSENLHVALFSSEGGKWSFKNISCQGFFQFSQDQAPSKIFYNAFSKS